MTINKLLITAETRNFCSNDDKNLLFLNLHGDEDGVLLLSFACTDVSQNMTFFLFDAIMEVLSLGLFTLERR
jgi:hypothetical protein